MHNALKIAAVVVTFNRKELLKRNLRMLLAQDEYIDAIVIVDNNSTDGTEEEVKKVFSDEFIRFDYNYLPINTGGAGGFEFGVRRAFSLGYDLIWLMDDDGCPMNSQTLSCLTEKIDSIGINDKAFILNSLVLCDENTLTFSLANLTERIAVEEISVDDVIHDDFSPCICPFNGTLLSRELVRQIGYPNGQLVIYGDESDYARRAIKASAYVATAVDSHYYHPRNSNYRVLFGRKISWLKGAKWRYYYLSRNLVYLSKGRLSFPRLLREIIRRNVFIILVDDQKMRSLYYTWRGVFDGVRGQLGAVVGPPAEGRNRR